MKHNYFFKKTGLMLAVAGIFSLNAFGQTYTWTGTAGDSEYTTLGNWDDGLGNAPTDIKAGTYQIPANVVVNQTIGAVASGSSNLSLIGAGATLNLQKGFLGTNLNMVNGSVLNVENKGEADATLVNLRNGSGNYLAAGTINVGTPAGTGSKAIFAAKALIAIGNGTDNVNVLNVYANGGLDCGSNNLLRIHHARDNGSGTVNILGATISTSEIQVGENTTSDIGSAFLNVYSGSITTTTLAIPRSGSENPNSTCRTNIYNGILTVATNLQIGTYGKIEFKLNTDNSAPTGKLIMPSGTKSALEAMITDGKITKPDGYDWVWDETAGVTLSVAPSTTPIELVSFSVSKTADGVKLDWATATEKDNDKFIVEHSTDGKNFTNLTSIVAKNTASSYTFSHNGPASGANYYRLIQVDLNGTKNVVGIKSINFKLSAGSPISIFPNPTSDVINVAVAGKENSTKTITITDLTGKVVLKQSASGANVALNLKDKLVSGTYIIHVNVDGINESQKIIIK